MNYKVITGKDTREDFYDINIKDKSGKLNTYRIEHFESVWSLKKKIESKIKVSMDKIDLRTINHRFLNNEIVSNYIVPYSNQVIELFTENDEFEAINVNFITDEGNEFSLNLNPEYTILQVIEKVAQHLQVEISQVQLFYESEFLEPKYNSINLFHYWIIDGSTINVKIKKISKDQPGSYKVFIKLLTGKHVTYDALPTDIFKDLAMKLEIDTGIPYRRMLLIFKGRIINTSDDEDPTLEEKGVVADSTLHIRLSNR